LIYAGTWRCHILPPSEPAVELLRAVDIRDRDDDDLQLHVDRSDLRLASVPLIDYIFRSCHLLFLLCILPNQKSLLNANFNGRTLPQMTSALSTALGNPKHRAAAYP